MIRAVLRNGALRRVLLAYVGFNAAEYAVWLAMLVYAYNRGGTTTAGLVAVIQLAPAALCAPFLGGLADRYPPVRVLAAGYVVQAVAMGATAGAILAGAPAPLAYACAAVAATAVTVTRPTQAVVTPALAHSAEELTATNVVSGWVENGSIFVATALAGVVLGASGPGAVFLLCAALGVVSALLVTGVKGPPAALDATESGPFDDAIAGFRALAEHGGPRMIVGLLGLEMVIYGALDLLFVVLALKLLSVGSAWVGYFNAFFAAGGVAGAAAAVTLVGKRHMAPAIVVGLLVWGASFMVIAASSKLGIVAVILLVGGAARAFFDVAAKTLLQRISPAEVLARVFGVLEATSMAGMAIGQLLVAGLVALTSASGAMAGVGVLLFATTLLVLRRLVSIDRGARVPIVEISLLRSIPLFRALPAPEIEGIARALEPREASDGEVIIREGEIGDRYYAIADGSVEISHNGSRVAIRGRAEGFGEIALLRDVPRTATVTAVGQCGFRRSTRNRWSPHSPATHHRWSGPTISSPRANPNWTHANREYRASSRRRSSRQCL